MARPGGGAGTAFTCLGVALSLACGGERDGGSEPAASSPFTVEYGAWTAADQPALPRGEEGAWDEGLVDPGAMIRHEGRFHMLYNGMRDWPTPLAVGYATSVDARTWRRASDAPVFAPEPVPWGRWTVRANSVVVEDGVWALYFSAADEGRLAGVVGRATAPGPTGPWTVQEDPVLTPGPGGAWDAEAVGHAKVMPSAEGFVMFYTGWGAGSSAIGRATSRDGITWVKDGQPVLTAAAEPGASDRRPLSDATAVRTADGRWLMTYRTGAGPDDVALGVAVSNDGRTWTRSGDGPLARPGTDTAYDMIFLSNLITTQNHQLLFFAAGERGTSTTDVHLVYRESRIR